MADPEYIDEEVIADKNKQEHSADIIFMHEAEIKDANKSLKSGEVIDLDGLAISVVKLAVEVERYQFLVPMKSLKRIEKMVGTLEVLHRNAYPGDFMLDIYLGTLHKKYEAAIKNPTKWEAERQDRQITLQNGKEDSIRKKEKHAAEKKDRILNKIQKLIDEDYEP